MLGLSEIAMMRKGVSGKKETASASKLQSNKSKNSAGVQTVPRSISEKQPRSTPHTCEKATATTNNNNNKQQSYQRINRTNSDRQVMMRQAVRYRYDEDDDNNVQSRILLLLVVMVIMAYWIGFLYFKTSQFDSRNKILISAIHECRNEFKESKMEHKEQIEIAAKEREEDRTEIQRLKEQMASLESDHNELLHQWRLADTEKQSKVNELQSTLSECSSNSTAFMTQLQETSQLNSILTRDTETLQESVNELRLSEESLKDSLQCQQYEIENVTLDREVLEMKLYDRMKADYIREEEINYLKDKLEDLYEEMEEMSEEHEAKLEEKNEKLAQLIAEIKNENDRFLLMDKAVKKQDATIQLLKYQIHEEKSRNTKLQTSLDKMSALTVSKPKPKMETKKMNKPGNKV